MENKKIIGSYELIEEIGRGGTSIVYKAKDLNHSKTVVVKLLHPCICKDQYFFECFKSHYKALNALHQPTVLRVLDYGRENNQFYYVMDFIEGYSIRQIIEQTGPVPLNTIFSILRKVSTTLHHLHRNNFLHLNLKSNNILVQRDCNIYITDFGLTKNICLQIILEGKILSSDVHSTFGYVAPEQLYSVLGPIGEATDIYSLGIILFEMLTGQLPFSEQKNPVNLAHMHITVLPPRLLKFRMDLDPRLEQFVMKMLEKDPKDRFQTMKEFLVALNEMEKIVLQDHQDNPTCPKAVVEISTEDQSFTKSFEDFSKTFNRKCFNEIFKAKNPSFPPMEERNVLGRYRITRLMTHFMLSNIYFGHDLEKDSPITLQVPVQSTPAFKQRLKEDFQAMKEIEHPGFVKILDLAEEDGFIFIIREFVRGKTIKDLVKKGKLNIERSIRITISILEALAYLHARGIVHRDLNSEIVTITPNLEAKITNLMITRAEDASSVSSGSFMGVVQYTAPEQISQSKYDVRSDLYSAGILLFELLTGSPPFNSNHPIEVMDMQIKKAPRFPENTQNVIPLNLQFIVLKALSKNPEERFQHASEFKDELSDFLISYTQALYAKPDALSKKTPPPDDEKEENTANKIPKTGQKKKPINFIESLTNNLIPSKIPAEDTEILTSLPPDPQTPVVIKGSKAYAQWISFMLGLQKTEITILSKAHEFDFRIVSSPEEMEAMLQQKINQGFSARILAGYCWNWSQELDAEGKLPCDIVIENYRRPWLAHPELMILPRQVPRASFWAYDPNGFLQIGNIAASSEFEFDYIGLIFGNDLRYSLKTHTWISNPEVSFDPRIRQSSLSALDLFKNSYLTLMSRGKKGCYAYFTDPDTESYFRNHIEEE